MLNIHSKAKWFISQRYILFILWRLPYITRGWTDWAQCSQLRYMKSLADIRHLWIYPNYSNTTLHSVDTSECVYSALGIRQTKNNFVKFLWQDVSNLFSTIQHFLSWTSSLWVHTPQSSGALSTAITICLSQACLNKKWDKPMLNIISQGIGPFTYEKTITTANHCTDQEQKQKTSLEKLQEIWPLAGAASNGVKYRLLDVQSLLFFCPCSLS